MKSRVFIIGLIFLVYGLVNLLWFVPEFGLINTPFPFDHVNDLDKSESGKIILNTQSQHSLASALQIAPYWFIWSMSLYCGAGVIGGVLIRK